MKSHLEICPFAASKYRTAEEKSFHEKNKEFSYLCSAPVLKLRRSLKAKNRAKDQQLDARYIEMSLDAVNLLPLAVGNSRLSKYDSELHKAVLSQDLVKMEELLVQGFDPNTVDADGWTALHVAAHQDDEEAVRLLLKHRADPRVKSATARSPLLLAITNNARLTIVKMLLTMGADVNEVVTDYGLDICYYIHIAVEDGNLELLKILLDNKADLEARNCCFETGLHLACRRQCIEMVELLLERGADPEQQDGYKRTCLHVSVLKSADAQVTRLLLAQRAGLEQRDENGLTALHYSVKSNNYEIAALLCASGADANVAADNGESALHLACRRPLEPLGDTINAVLGAARRDQPNPLIKLLVLHGADIEAKDQAGRTPVHTAVRDRHARHLQQLLDLEAALDVEEAHGWDPLELCLEHGSEECAIALVRSGAGVSKLIKQDKFWAEEGFAAARLAVFRHVYARYKANLHVDRLAMEVLSKHELWREIAFAEHEFTDELARMKSEWVHEGVTADWILHANRSQLAALGANLRMGNFLMMLYRKVAVRDELPMYHEILRKNLLVSLTVAALFKEITSELDIGSSDALLTASFANLMAYLRIYDMFSKRSVIQHNFSCLSFLQVTNDRDDYI